MTTYEQIQLAISKAVNGARRADKKLAVGRLALRISSAHPQSGLTLDELRACIDAEINRQSHENSGGDDRLPSRSGDRRPGHTGDGGV